MTEKFPIDKEIIEEIKQQLEVDKLATASIRNIVQLVNLIENKTGTKFIRTEMGVPGLPALKTGVEAEIEALKKGVASIYPPIEGIKELKNEVSRFAKLFLNIDISPEGCVPTVGSMQGAMTAFLVVNRCDKNKNNTLFIDPGFPVNKRQLMILGLPFKHFDIYNYRGDKLKAKLTEYLEEGDISSFIYSNPNNPSWICFTEKELGIIGDLASKYNIIVIEDLAYFGMDFRKHYGKAGMPPYQPTVANYTDNYVLLVSSSKAFSYAGQRIAAMLISDKLFHKHYPDLLRYFSTTTFGNAIIQDAIYALSAGTAYSPQAGFAAMLKSLNDGIYDFTSDIRIYGERARIMKKLFTDNGFVIVYGKDEDKDIADGFYFTVSYPGMSGETLLFELIRYGISAITLDTTGSERTEGLRICVSKTSENDYPVLEERLTLFKENHS